MVHEIIKKERRGGRVRLTQKYRPKTWDEIKGNPKTIRTIRRMIEQLGEGCPNLLFIGPPGVGKTSTAYVIKNVLGADWHEYNTTDERGIHFIRGELRRLTMYLGFRIILIDEADNLTIDALQAMRGVLEKEKQNALIILVGNDPDGFIDAVYSRCSPFKFDRLTDEDIDLRIREILKAEQIKFDDRDVLTGLRTLIASSNGDMRSALNRLEGVIDRELNTITPESIDLYITPGLGRSKVVTPDIPIHTSTEEEGHQKIRYPKTRRRPVEHEVRGYTRKDGKIIRSFTRGSGNRDEVNE